jgi:hypothetical protein
VKLVYHVTTTIPDWNALHEVCKMLGQDSPTRVLDRASIPPSAHPAWYTVLQQYTNHAGALLYLGFVFILPESETERFMRSFSSVEWVEIGNRRGITALLGLSSLTNWEQYAIIVDSDEWREHMEQVQQTIRKIKFSI